MMSPQVTVKQMLITHLRQPVAYYRKKPARGRQPIDLLN
jgi:hypothetical protein